MDRIERFNALRKKAAELRQRITERDALLREHDRVLAEVRAEAKEKTGVDTREGLQTLVGRLERELDVLLPGVEERLEEVGNLLAEDS